MTYEQNCSAMPANLAHPCEALLLKLRISDCKHFVNQHHLGLHVGCDAKREPHVHSARVVLHRCVEKLLDFRKSDDLIELASNLHFSHAQYRAVKKNILTAGELGME